MKHFPFVCCYGRQECTRLKLEKFGPHFLSTNAMPAKITKNIIVSATLFNLFDSFFITLQEHFLYRYWYQAMTLERNGPKTDISS